MLYIYIYIRYYCLYTRTTLNRIGEKTTLFFLKKKKENNIRIRRVSIVFIYLRFWLTKYDCCARVYSIYERGKNRSVTCTQVPPLDDGYNNITPHAIV